MTHGDPAWDAVVQRAVEAARAAGARYADARITRQEMHRYGVQQAGGSFDADHEVVGIGVRALVNGFWGYSSSTVLEPDEAVRLAQDAVGQARANAAGSAAWEVELGTIPLAKGTWSTPIRIDPFAISIEEKLDYLSSLVALGSQAGLEIPAAVTYTLRFVREERVMATSEGAHVRQTLYESGGEIQFQQLNRPKTLVAVHGIALAGAGWELLLEANIPDQLLSGQLRQEGEAVAKIPIRPAEIGKYTVVWDGAAMGRFVEATLGAATQLDRALGYEADARGTSFLNDPLAMVGTFPLAAPSVTITANRSAARQLATVQWDDDGVEPQPFPIVKDGVLVDFQTTREQAAWLAPYYAAHGLPVRSHGCAAAESAHFAPIQQMPNLALEPNPQDVTLAHLVADVEDGMLLEGGGVVEVDFQARTGLFMGQTRKITHGQLGPILRGGAFFFTSQQMWKQLLAVGGASTQAVVSTSAVFDIAFDFPLPWKMKMMYKGQPPQASSRSVRAAAAVIPNVSMIDPGRKAS